MTAVASRNENPPAEQCSRPGASRGAWRGSGYSPVQSLHSVSACSSTSLTAGSWRSGGVAWPGPGWSFAPAGCSTVPTNAILVRYRMPVSAAAGAHACGVGTGTYEPCEVANPAYYHDSSLAAFGPATVARRSTCPISTTEWSACGASRLTRMASWCPRRAPCAGRMWRPRVGQSSSRRPPRGFAPRQASPLRGRLGRRRSMRGSRSAGRARTSSPFPLRRSAGARPVAAHGRAGRS